MIKFIPLSIFSIFAFLNVSNYVEAKNLQSISGKDNPIVLELFTSQSCSSCPPADRLLKQIEAENDNIIALSCNVTYWNHLHWKDTLSNDFCDVRQRQYVSQLKSRGPYTPQIFVNGTQTGVGSRSSTIESAVEKTHHIQPIDIKNKDKNLQINLPKMATANYNILLVPYGHNLKQDIPSGENRGRSVHYTNPVLDIVNLGLWQGESRNFSYNISKIKKLKGVAVLIHEETQVGAIKAAGKIEL